MNIQSALSGHPDWAVLSASGHTSICGNSLGVGNCCLCSARVLTGQSLLKLYPENLRELTKKSSDRRIYKCALSEVKGFQQQGGAEPSALGPMQLCVLHA